MLNRVLVMGRLTRDPELRYTQNQTPVVSFSLAVERDYKGTDGSKVTDFFGVVAWRSTAEFVSNYFTKGRMMVVEGKLQTRKWQDRDGNNRISVEIVADSCYFGDSKRDSGGSYGGNGGGGYATSPGGNYSDPYAGLGGGQFSELTDEDGELPF